jgi:hypothetical protein
LENERFAVTNVTRSIKNSIHAVHILGNVINGEFSITSNSVIAFLDVRFELSSLKQDSNDKI